MLVQLCCFLLLSLFLQAKLWFLTSITMTPDILIHSTGPEWFDVSCCYMVSSDVSVYRDVMVPSFHWTITSPDF